MRRLLPLWVLAMTACAGVQFVPLPREAEAHRAKTDDGWEISLTRYHAVGPSTGPPVVLCHGIGANARNMDLDEHHSMARWFAAHGREAWTMSVRGSGDSDHADASKGRGPISFDDYWRHDLPAVIAYVKTVTGAKAVDFAGHSMGGMVAYAYLSQGGQGVRAAATLGSPTRLDWGTGLEAVLSAAEPVLSPSGTVPAGAGAHLAAPFQTLVDDGPFQRFFYNPQTTDPSAWQRLVAYGTSDVSGGVAIQLISLIKTGKFCSLDRVIDFRQDMAKITTPVLVVAAKLDRVALTPSVKDGYRALGGPKEWLLITRANGSRGEYGHMDLVIGERAGDEVWSKVLAFFNRQPEP